MSEHIATDAEIAEIERLANAATPGPWECLYVGDRQPFVLSHGYSDEEPLVCTGTHEWPMTLEEGRFIAACRSAVPALIARIRADGERLTQARDDRDAMGENYRHQLQRAEAAEALTQKWIEKSRDSDTQAFSNWNRAEAAEAERDALRAKAEQVREYIVWAANESNALSFINTDHTSTGEVWWCEFCDDETSAIQAVRKESIKHRPDCLHLRAAELLAVLDRKV